jgi:hypothetical protein
LGLNREGDKKGTRNAAVAVWPLMSFMWALEGKEEKRETEGGRNRYGDKNSTTSPLSGKTYLVMGPGNQGSSNSFYVALIIIFSE